MDREESAIRASWTLGRLYTHLNPSQKKIYDAYHAAKADHPKFVVNCSRKLGKSVLGLFIATECALSKPNSLVAFIAPTVDHVQKYIKQLYQVVYATCPEDLKPRVLKAELVFQNGSKILFCGVGRGTGDSYNNLRSFAFDLVILDEAGFSANLDEIVDGVLVSTLLPRNGSMLLLSTPPVTPDHAFTGYCNQAKLDGTYIQFTIRDSHYPLAQQDKFIRDLGGIDSHKVRREYFCEFVVDKDFQLCPEWKDEFEQTVVDDPYYKHWFKYEGLDQGWTDNSVCLFGYVRWVNGRSEVVFKDEISMKSPEQTTDHLAITILAKEKEVFRDHQVKRRIADNNTPSLLQDFNLRHGLYFYPVESKARLDVMVSDVREIVKDSRVFVDPKCKQLLGCMRNGVWVKTKGGARGTEFARSKVYGHYDGFAACMYFLRECDLKTNPLPPMLNRKEEDHFIPRAVIEAQKAKTGEIISAGLDDAMAQPYNYQDHDSEDYE